MPWTLTALLAVLVVLVGLSALRGYGGSTFDGWDFRMYLVDWPDPYACPPANACYTYSPAFAALMTPFSWLPFGVALGVWRVIALGALALSVRGLGWAGLLVFLVPGLWDSDILAGNTQTLALAAMIAVIRWPSVATVAGYAVLVALIPKPQFLPVLVYGVWHVPAARLWVAGIAAAGLAMLAWPGYLQALYEHAGNIGVPPFSPPLWLTWPLAAALTVAGLRYSRLLGPASVLAAAYYWPYVYVPLALVLISARRMTSTASARRRRAPLPSTPSG